MFSPALRGQFQKATVSVRRPIVARYCERILLWGRPQCYTQNVNEVNEKVSVRYADQPRVGLSLVDLHVDVKNLVRNTMRNITIAGERINNGSRCKLPRSLAAASMLPRLGAGS